MSRIRTIKPEFWTSEQVMNLSWGARLLFIGSWNYADDTGRHKLNYRTLKAQIFPADDITSDAIRGMFQELIDANLVGVYAVDGVEYFEITGWRHQRIDKPQRSRYPENPNTIPRTFVDGSYLIRDKGRDLSVKNPGEAEGSNEPSTISGMSIKELNQLRKKYTNQNTNPDYLDGYIEDFEELWLIYRSVGDPNSSKARARDAFFALSEEERIACSVPLTIWAYLELSERKRDPRRKTKHLETWITARMFEQFNLQDYPEVFDRAMEEQKPLH